MPKLWAIMSCVFLAFWPAWSIELLLEDIDGNSDGEISIAEVDSFCRDNGLPLVPVTFYDTYLRRVQTSTPLSPGLLKTFMVPCDAVTRSLSSSRAALNLSPHNAGVLWENGIVNAVVYDVLSYYNGNGSVVNDRAMSPSLFGHGIVSVEGISCLNRSVVDVVQMISLARQECSTPVLLVTVDLLRWHRDDLFGLNEGALDILAQFQRLDSNSDLVLSQTEWRSASSDQVLCSCWRCDCDSYLTAVNGWYTV